jgi:peptidoglycan/LPS O-acetylase OafA/YrhL
MENNSFLNILLTSIPIIFVFVLLALSIKKRDKNQESFSIFEYSDSSALRALFAVIIVFVHVPDVFGNYLQDAIGSFAGVGVAFFFMMSSLGCCNKYMKESPKHFFITFWPKRVVSLFLPNLLINFAYCIFSLCMGHGFNGAYLLKFNYYLYAISVLYLLLFIFFALDTLFKRKKTKLFLFLCLLISISLSFVTYLTKISFYFKWPVESLFGALGILVFVYRKQVSNFVSKNVLLVSVMSLVVSICLGAKYQFIKSESFGVGFIFKFFLIFSILVFIVSLTTIFKFKKKPICYLSNLSFGLYLAHVSLIGIVSEFYPYEFPLRSGVFILTFFGISLALAAVVYLITKPIIYLLSKALNHIQ